MAAGDQRGAQAWRREERTVERNRLANAINRGNQTQVSMFGVTEYDETMPLFQQQATVGKMRRDTNDQSLEERIDAAKKKCVTGYGCGASCIPVAKQCRITPMSGVSQQRMKRLMALAAGGASPREQEGKSPTERRIAALNATRNQLGKNLVASLSRRRPDGQGNYIENPDAAAMQQIKSTGLRVAKIDRQLNVLEGKEPDEKRWIDGDPYGLTRYSDFQSPGRMAYERKVIARELKGATVGDQAVFMSGGPASGKTSLLKKQFGAAEGFAVIDPDRIKGYDPVMQLGVAMGMKQAAALAHENSSRLSKEVYATARDRGFNVLMDGTGANAGKYIGQMQELKGKGYQITLLAQHVPEEVGVKRALARADRTGRYVPREFIQHAYEVIPGNFERIAQVADRATLNDGESNQVIMQYQAGMLVGGSRKRRADYRRRYGKPQYA
jgi:predicted ABC-type ATPase